MENDLKDNPDYLKVKAAVDAISEHFDTVQIFVNRHESSLLDGTMNINYGVGNWFSRYGQVREWCIKQDEYVRERIRKDENE